MQRVLSGLKSSDGTKYASVYIDDVLVFSHSMEDHIQHLASVLERIRAAKLKLKPSKCRLLREEVEYLGHSITPNGLKPITRHLDAVKEFLASTTVKQTRQFLGLASYYRRFIPNFAKVAHPLYALTRKDPPFIWSSECQDAFISLKNLLVMSPVLTYPNFAEPFHLETDASIHRLGALVLSQRQSDGKLHPVAYASRTVSDAEKNYGINELETLSVVWSISHFH